MERMEVTNPREVIKKLLRESKTCAGENEIDPLAYFEQNVDWDEVNPFLCFRMEIKVLISLTCDGICQVPFFDSAPNIESWELGSLVRFRCMVQVKNWFLSDL